MEKITPDTNVLIAYFGNSPIAGPLLEAYISDRKIILSIVVISEFLVKATIKEEKILREFAKLAPVRNVDWEIADEAVKLRRETLRKTNIHMLDCFIAATAKISKATLLTFDRRDFPFKGLKLKEIKYA